MNANSNVNSFYSKCFLHHQASWIMVFIALLSYFATEFIIKRLIMPTSILNLHGPNNNDASNIHFDHCRPHGDTPEYSEHIKII